MDHFTADLSYAHEVHSHSTMLTLALWAMISSFVFNVIVNFSALVHTPLTTLSTCVVVNKQHKIKAKINTTSKEFLIKIMSTQYDTLNVGRSASKSEIKTAYHRVLLKNHPDKTHMLGPFARSIADQKTRAANAAWRYFQTHPPRLRMICRCLLSESLAVLLPSPTLASIALGMASVPSEASRISQRSQTNGGQPTLHPVQTSKLKTMIPGRKLSSEPSKSLQVRSSTSRSVSGGST